MPRIPDRFSLVLIAILGTACLLVGAAVVYKKLEQLEQMMPEPARYCDARACE